MKLPNVKPLQPNSKQAAQTTLKEYLGVLILLAVVAFVFGIVIGLLLNPAPAVPPVSAENATPDFWEQLQVNLLIRAGIGALGGIIVVLAFQKLKKHLQTGFGKQDPIGKDKVAILYNKDQPIKHLSGKTARYHPNLGQKVEQISRSQENQNITYTCMSADRIPLLVHMSADTSITNPDVYIKKNKIPYEVVASEIKNIITREIGRRDQQAASNSLDALTLQLMNELPAKIDPYGLQLDSIRIENIGIDRRYMTNAALLAEDIQTLDSKVRLADRRTISLLSKQQKTP